MESKDGMEKSKKIAKMIVDRDVCISAGTCVAATPGVYRLDEENKAVFIRKDGKDTSDTTSPNELKDESATNEDLLLAAQSCPVQAIILYDKEGNQIYP